jgi:FkbM family methyltransferase
LIYWNNSYEEKFDKLFSSKLEPGYIIYDIGANMGHYSIIYSKIVGRNGKVIAFEPSILNYSKLQLNCEEFKDNILTINAALGSERNKLYITQGSDSIGATSSLAKDAVGDGNWVEVFPIDDLINKYGLPNAIKIDVEGFELDVLAGAKSTLANNKVRLIGIEIHTELLNNKGIEDCHAKIESILKEYGFKTKFPDFSHIVGYR